MVNCPACNGLAKVLFSKDGYDYHQCDNCWTVFIPEGLPQGGKVGGEHEVGRNEKENGIRIDRITKLVGTSGRILDFACGHGMLVADCKKAGLSAVGYDKYNSDFDKIPDGQFNIVTMIEIIEHLHGNMEELDLIHDKLLPGGVLMVETSFVDVALEENISLKDFFYFSVINGHATVFSHYGMDIMMYSKGFEILPPINRNVRLFRKKINA